MVLRPPSGSSESAAYPRRNPDFHVRSPHLRPRAPHPVPPRGRIGQKRTAEDPAFSIPARQPKVRTAVRAQARPWTHGSRPSCFRDSEGRSRIPFAHGERALKQIIGPSIARRSPLARRTPIRPSPDHRVARNPRGQERALDPDDACPLRSSPPSWRKPRWRVAFRAGSASSA